MYRYMYNTTITTTTTNNNHNTHTTNNVANFDDAIASAISSRGLRRPGEAAAYNLVT